MTDRITAGTPLVCSDERHAAKVADLERQLAALRAVARGYCPACGRGDAAPTVEDWEQQKRRADQAEELLSIAHDTSNKSEAERARAVQRAEQAEREADATATAAAHLTTLARQRAERAEAAVARVRALTGWAINGWSDLSPTKILAALDQPAPTAATQTTDGPACRYCGADCSDGRSWDGGNLYACGPCAAARAAANKAATQATEEH